MPDTLAHNLDLIPFDWYWILAYIVAAIIGVIGASRA